MFASLSTAGEWWGLAASVVTVAVVAYGVVRWVLRSIVKDLHDIKTQVTPNGGNTQRNGDLTLTSAQNTSAILESVQKLTTALDEHSTRDNEQFERLSRRRWWW